MITYKRTDSTHPDFKQLVDLLDADLAIRDGGDHAFYHQFNGITDIGHAIVAYSNDIPVGCGAIKAFRHDIMEVKRMYVIPESRGKGLGSGLLSELEQWAAELGNTHCILETGKRQPEAIALYKKNGYSIIPNYPPYETMENSVCFQKAVSSQKNQNS